MGKASVQFGGILEEHFKKNYLFYFLVISSLVIGVIFGTIIVCKVDSSQGEELIKYLEDFFRGFDFGNLAARGSVAKEEILANLKILGIAWLLGISVIGVPLLIVILFIRGFIIGFTVGFLIKEFSFKGVLMALLSILPHNLLFLPALCLISISAFSFASTLWRNRRTRYKNTIYQGAIGFTVFAVLMLILGGMAGFVEAYITPVFMRVISKFLV